MFDLYCAGEGYFELLPAALGFTNMCVSINNGNRTGWYKRHLNVSVEECMQRVMNFMS